MDPKQLLQLAKEARQRAYAPYSGYRVGAALLCKDGTVYSGCNIENASYPATVCAERTALFKAVSEGQRNFIALAVVGGSAVQIGDFAYPCGICRQALSEFCTAEMPVHFENEQGEIRSYTMTELLPHHFSSAHLSE